MPFDEDFAGHVVLRAGESAEADTGRFHDLAQFHDVSARDLDRPASTDRQGSPSPPGSGAHHVLLDFLATDLAEMHESLNRFAREVRPQVE